MPWSRNLRQSQVVREVERRFPDGVPLIDPVSDMKVEHESVPKLMRKLEGLQSRREAAAAQDARGDGGHGRGGQ
eukprot:1743509-Pleurochrysis_carterae.AAC.1